jgi:hypothetical protein
MRDTESHFHHSSVSRRKQAFRGNPFAGVNTTTTVGGTGIIVGNSVPGVTTQLDTPSPVEDGLFREHRVSGFSCHATAAASDAVPGSETMAHDSGAVSSARRVSQIEVAGSVHTTLDKPMSKHDDDVEAHVSSSSTTADSARPVAAVAAKSEIVTQESRRHPALPPLSGSPPRASSTSVPPQRPLPTTAVGLALVTILKPDASAIANTSAPSSSTGNASGSQSLSASELSVIGRPPVLFTVSTTTSSSN